MTKYIYGAVVRKSDEGGYWAEVPDLPGCFGEGATFVEAVGSISDGIETHLAALIEYGKDIPEAKKTCSDDGDVVYVYADPDTVELMEPSVSAAEAARRLGVTPGRVSQLISAGKLEARRDVDGTMVTVASVDEYASGPRSSGRPRKAVTA